MYNTKANDNNPNIITGTLDVVQVMREASRQVQVPTSQRHRNKKRDEKRNVSGRGKKYHSRDDD